MTDVQLLPASCPVPLKGRPLRTLLTPREKDLTEGTVSEVVNQALQRVGIKCLESFSCWLNDSGNAAIPATIPAIMNTRDTMDQITPQHCEEPPYFWAKTLASEVFTLRRMRSSHYPKTVVSAGREDRRSVRLGEISQCPRRCKGQT